MGRFDRQWQPEGAVCLMKGRFVGWRTGGAWLLVCMGLLGCDMQPNPELIKSESPGEPTLTGAGTDILARVDGVPITRATFQAMLMQTAEFYKSRGLPMTQSPAEVGTMILDQLIARELVYQEARKRGMEADAQIEQALNEAREKAGGEEPFKAILAQRGVTEEMIWEVTRRQILTEQIIDQELASKVEITPEAVEAFYAENAEMFLMPERVHARHILIAIPEGSPETVRVEARQKIEELAARLTEGADFATLASQESEDQASSGNGGDLGFFTRAQMPPAFADAAFDTEPGQVSGVVQTSFGFHLIRVEEHLPEQQVELNEELRVAIRRQMTQERVKDLLRDWARELEGSHEVERYVAPEDLIPIPDGGVAETGVSEKGAAEPPFDF
ncbi:MAG TPA: hypothetical protein DEW46_16955 [Verrucomicrobia bacterium]|nr:hypothetical protein [Verrucomicrobiota bacterium]